MKKEIPYYKRDKYIFISNLNDVTANEQEPLSLKREGYLLSEYYSSKSNEELANYVKIKNNLLISDNGNFSKMKAISKLFEKKGFAILNKAINEESEIGNVSEFVLNERLELIKLIEIECKKSMATTNFNTILENQVYIKPDYIICFEDFNIPVLMMCGLMHPVFKPKALDVKNYQLQTSEIFNKQIKGDFGQIDSLSQINKFKVLHSYDFNSAVQSVEVANKSKANGYAISFGGPMKSKRWITSLNMGEKEITFKEKLPEPYLISTAISLGVNKKLDNKTPVHILGVGTPILIALFGYLFNNSKAISIDSTAPFKDAYAGTLYGSKSAFLKMDMYKVAANCLIENKAYKSSTPFFKRFEKQFPSNWSNLRTELKINKNSSIKSVANLLIENPSLVEKYIPFFSKMRSGNDEMINILRTSRAGHNYWVLRKICISVRNRMNDPIKLEKWTEYQVNRYIKVTSEKWGLAVLESFRIAKLHNTVKNNERIE
ncbi:MULTISPECIES: hypothetical protein [Flavobacterium]|uniref:Uncharacterized protein n=1 Tax=Flavobacterium jumunjinense TaxID=998845 RepID=A0ABV5GKT5_9FLAO|nr:MULTISPECIES: hypothetical protein [Flavobacterium]